MKRRGLLALLAGGSGLSGCLRLASTGDSTPTGRTETASPATPGGTGERTPTAERTPPGDASFPIGLSEDGADELLFETHARTLSGSSFHVEWTKVDRTRSEIEWQKEYRGDHGVALGEWVRIDGGTVGMYRSGPDAYWREDIGGGYTYGNDPSGYDVDRVLWAGELRALLEAGAWEPPSVVQEAPRTTWELRADGISTASASPRDTAGSIVSISAATLEVDDRGVIRHLEAVYAVDQAENDPAAEYETRYSVSSIGDVSIDPPAWLPTAEERAPIVSVSLTDDRRYVKLRIESGNRLEPGTVIQVHDRERRDSRIHLRLDEPLEPGTTAYIYQYRPADEFPSGRISRGGRPSDASPEELANDYDIWARRRDSLYFKVRDFS